jgi:hypothetical protein
MRKARISPGLRPCLAMPGHTPPNLAIPRPAEPSQYTVDRNAQTVKPAQVDAWNQRASSALSRSVALG